MTSTFQTAGCGPARPVVWQGTGGVKPAGPYADPRRREAPRHSRPGQTEIRHFFKPCAAEPVRVKSCSDKHILTEQERGATLRQGPMIHELVSALSITLAIPLTVSAQTSQLAETLPPVNLSEPSPPPKSEHPFLEDLFLGGLTPDQVKALGEHPTLERQAATMSSEQRTTARQKLHEAEGMERSPERLRQIAQGYLMLDKHSLTRGQNATRVAQDLIKLEPKNPEGWRLAAQGYYQQGNPEAAAKSAEEALKRAPHDPVAIAIYHLTIGRSATKGAVSKTTPNASVKRDAETAGASSGLAKNSGDSSMPIKLPVKASHTQAVAVPSLIASTPNEESKNTGHLPLLPLATAILGLGITGYGILQAGKSSGSENTALPADATYKPSFLTDPVGAASELIFRAKIAIEDHPVTSIGLALGTIVTAAYLVGAPLLGLGGGGGAPALAMAGTGSASAETTAIGGSILKGAAAAGAVVGSGSVASDAISRSGYTFAASDRIPDHQNLTREANSPDAADTGGQLTKAGRSLAKHNKVSRSTSRLPKPQGNSQSINKAAQQLVDTILNDPARTETFRDTGRFGRVLEIRRPGGIGIRFGPNDEFLHFIE